MLHKARKIHHLLRQCPRPLQPPLLLEILEEPAIVLCQGDDTTRRGADYVVGLAFFQRLLQPRKRLACHCRAICAVARIESNQAATILLPWERDLDTTGPQHLNGGLTHFRIQAIDHTSREVADCDASMLCTILACCTP